MLESFFIFGNLPPDIEKGVYQIPLVILSYIVASFSSYTAFALSHYLIIAKSVREKRLFHWGGAFAMGAGIWSMHFIGMLSYKMHMAVRYDPSLTFFSMLIAIAAAYEVISITVREQLSIRQISMGAVLLGCGICGMHYTGMAAMQMDASLLYLPDIFILSVIIAIVASGVALWMSFTSARDSSRHYLFQAGAALVMGAAICAMHYTGMAAAIFIPHANMHYDFNQNSDALALAIAAIAGIILSLALIIGFYRKVQITSQLRETKALLAAIIESSDDAIISKNFDNIITSWNAGAERLFGYTAAEAIGQPVTLIIPPERHVEEHQIMNRLQQGQRVEHFQTIRMTKDGRRIDISLTVSAIRDDSGNIIGASKVARDITEYRRTQKALNESTIKSLQSQKMEAIGNLTNGIAHDFNNLLSVIIGNLDLLLDRPKNDTQTEPFMHAALDAALRCVNLTRRLLAFARQQPLQPQRIDINKLIEDMAKFLDHMLGGTIQISLDLGMDVWPIFADPVQVEATLTNLATNARDVMPHGGRLTFTTVNRHLDAGYISQHAEIEPGDYIVIEVSDTGAGISPEIMPHIFEPFFTTKEHSKGTGLGLSMAFGFMRQSGGHIDVYSTINSGTTFRLYWPRLTQVAAVSSVPTPILPIDRKGCETVLVVEDNNAVRLIVTRQLTELGYRVLEAPNATAALEVLAANPVDLLFADIVMPGKFNGQDLAQLAIERWPSLRILLTSGFPETKINGPGDSTNPMRFLNKPYRKSELAHIIREVLEGAPLKN